MALHDRNDFASNSGAELRAPGDGAALVFGVESVDASVERLRGLGVEIAAEPKAHPDWGIRTAHVRDPDGNVIELNEPIDEESWSDELRDEAARYDS
jgi:catechol 2,3-dioxygenase-like lactoylglutathione lyase family enzyme